MQIAIGLYSGLTALDAIGPYQVFASVPGAEVVLCAASTGEIVDDNGLVHLEVAHTFDDVPAPDVLLVPGGLIASKLARDGDPIIDWIRAAHPRTTYTTSVCFGSLLLGAAGLLDGVRATTHWYGYDQLRTFGAEPTEQRVVEAGKIVTAAGVSAGIDLALTLVGRLTSPEVAQAVQLGIEYDPQPPFDAGAPSKAPAPIRQVVHTLMETAERQLLDG